jgi:hypothetical protein
MLCFKILNKVKSSHSLKQQSTYLRARVIWLGGSMAEDKDELKKSLIVAQFTRASYDFRQYDEVIWQMPSVAITITSVVFAVAFNFVHNTIVSGVILLVGGFFDLTIAIALCKHRLMEDARAHYLKDIETEFGIKSIPVTTKEAEDYLGKSHLHVSYPWFRKRNAFKFLWSSVVLLTLALSVTGIFLIVSSILP